MESKTHEQMAAALFPYNHNGRATMLSYNDMVEAKRAAWLSRQTEVDELKQEVENADATIGKLSEGINELRDNLAAKVKECEGLKWQLNDASVICHNLQAENERLRNSTP
jgi:chromosome segregation ATPase